MLAWSPILVRQIRIHALGFVLRKLQLNRHRQAEVSTHAHEFTQLILYLAGEGVQVVNGVRRPARPGDLFVIPAGMAHGFSSVGQSRPLCLVLDYEAKDVSRVRSTHRRLPTARLNELHGLLAHVPAKGRSTLADYPAILAVVARLLGHAPATPRPVRPPTLYEKVTGLLTESRSTPARIAHATGYHRDHLTRKLKAEAGLGLRALRDRQRLEAAQTALRAPVTIADAAASAGFEDANYFSRWYRSQTGQTPSAWRRRNQRH